MEALIYLANSLYLTSYLVRDMLYLRLLSVTGALCLVGYFVNLAEPLVTVIAWNLVFVVLNLVHIGLLIRHRLRDRALQTKVPIQSCNKPVHLRKHFSNTPSQFDIR